VASLPAELDPLRGRGASPQLALRQLFEPLVAIQRPPYGEAATRRGLALGWEASADFRVWALRLRDGVSFQDGSALDAGAVVANAERWRSDPVGIRLLPGLTDADAPRPTLVRLIFAQPVRDLPRLLRDPRLGIVSPLALSGGAGADTVPVRGRRAGSGPFELRVTADGVLRMVRSRRWWGSGLGLGPALDRLSFIALAPAAARAEALRAGEVRIASQLSLPLTRRLRRDPLLAVLGDPPRAIAYERSVKGLTGTGPQPLSAVWVARLESG
jgi:ABC-type transport system substrate-binding protein